MNPLVFAVSVLSVVVCESRARPDNFGIPPETIEHPSLPDPPAREVNKHVEHVFYPPSGLGAVLPHVAFNDATPLNSPEKLNDYGFFAGTHYQTLAKIIYWVVKIWHFVIIVMQPFAFLSFNIAGVNYLREGINRFLALEGHRPWPKSPEPSQVDRLIVKDDNSDSDGVANVSGEGEGKTANILLNHVAHKVHNSLCSGRTFCEGSNLPIILRVLESLKILPSNLLKLLYCDTPDRKIFSCKGTSCSESRKDSVNNTTAASTAKTSDDDSTENGATEPDLTSNEIVA